MGRQSNIKKQRRMERLAGINNAKPANEFNFTTTIPKDMLLSYLLTKFVGKSGYRYISIGRAGSVFSHTDNVNIGAITMHRDFPVCLNNGRYADPQRRDIPIIAIHPPVGFPGIVVDKKANVYIGGNNTPASKEEVDNLLTDIDFVNKEEFAKAVEREQPLVEQIFNKFKEDMENKQKELEEMFNPYSNISPYDDMLEITPEIVE